LTRKIKKNLASIIAISFFLGGFPANLYSSKQSASYIEFCGWIC